MGASVKVTEFDHVDDFMDRLFREQTYHRPAIFRGQSDSKWSLVPSAWRSTELNRLTEVFGKSAWTGVLPKLDPGDPDLTVEQHLSRYAISPTPEATRNFLKLAVMLQCESTIVDAFCDGCDRVALQVPGVTQARQRTRLVDILVDRPTHEFGQSVIGFELTPAFALAQHVGLPTRLLDFSENPFKAAFFAVRGHSLDDYETSGSIAVWLARKAAEPAYAVSRLANFSGVETIRILRSQIEFLHAQDGLFVACNGLGNRYFIEHGTWPTFQDLMSDWELEQLVLLRTESPHLKARLHRMGISDLTMMPTFQQIAMHTRRTYFGQKNQ